MGDTKRDSAEVISGEPLTFADEVMYEAGKAMVMESVASGRSFCQSMISVSTGAIAVYVGLVKLYWSDKYVPTGSAGLWTFGPGLLFLLSAFLFVAGYLPSSTSFSLDILEEIEKARLEAINRRSFFAWSGFVTFGLGIALALAAAWYFLQLANAKAK